MKKIIYEVITVNMGNSSDDGRNYLVKLSKEGEDEVAIEGNAQYIISGNSFHIGSELSNLCEAHRLDEYTLVLALEARENKVLFELMDILPKFELNKISSLIGIKDVICDSSLQLKKIGAENVGENIIQLIDEHMRVISTFILESIGDTMDHNVYRCVWIDKEYNINQEEK